MQVLHLGTNLHIKRLKLDMHTFGVTQNAGITIRVRSSYKTLHASFRSDPKCRYCIQGWIISKCILCLGLGLHLRVSKPFRWVFLERGYYIRLVFSFQLEILKLILTFTNQNSGISLQYIHPYLPLPTGILGHNFNTCTCTYFHQTLTKKSLSDICPVATLTWPNVG